MNVVTVGEIATAVRGISFAGADVAPRAGTSTIACLTTGAVQAQVDWGSVRYIPADYVVNQVLLLRPGDIVVSTANSKTLVGKATLVGEVPFPATFGAFVTVLRPNAKVVPAFLGYWLQTDRYRATARDLASQTTSIANLRVSDLLAMTLPFPPHGEQVRIVAELDAQLGAVNAATSALSSQVVTAKLLSEATLDASLSGSVANTRLGDVLIETRRGVGPDWSTYPVRGATRAGLAPAKEGVGKSPERYKLVDRGSIFYNPMRILLGSIAHVERERDVGITSPDYVVFHCQRDRLDDRWFYQWLRSLRGEALIRSMARGAVRERLLFGRLAEAEVPLPPLEVQERAAEGLRAVSLVQNLIAQELSDLGALSRVLLRRAMDLDDVVARSAVTRPT